MSTPSAVDKHAEEWEAFVGKAILRFGDIELISVKCLSVLPEDQISESASRLEFGRRTDLIIELLEARESLSDHLGILLKGLKRAKQLSQIRNLIAHNPVMLDIYTTEDESRIITRHTITSARTGKKSIDLEELKEFASEVEHLASELWMVFLNVAGNSDHLWRNRSNGT
ncbi:MAG: hypothetical protein AB2821_04660 [Candidatus Thiodiazotropha endolucinida]